NSGAVKALIDTTATITSSMEIADATVPATVIAAANTNLGTATTTSTTTETATSSLLLPSSTPTLIIPLQCQDCMGPNNTNINNMTCYKNTQCIPLQYLCDNNSFQNACTDIVDTQDPNDDQDYDNGPILCQDQLCVAANFLPLPSPGSGKMSRSSSSDCLIGNYYSLFGSIPKYTQSCVEASNNYYYYSNKNPTATSSSGDGCQAWEYFVQGSCFLSTCGPGLDCRPPFVCQRTGLDQLYGICVDGSGGRSGDGGGSGSSPAGGATTKYSAQEYLVQGLLIGICCLALGIGLGVGFWHYKRKRFTSRWMGSHSEQTGTARTLHGYTTTRARSRTQACDSSASASTSAATATAFASASVGDRAKSWISSLLGHCRGKRPLQETANSTRIDPLSLSSSAVVAMDNRDSIAESIITQSSDIFVNNNSRNNRWRWRWGVPSLNNNSNTGFMFTRVFGPGGATLYPEMEPPPMYQNGPDLPSYHDSNEGIAMNTIHSGEGEGEGGEREERGEIENNSLQTSPTTQRLTRPRSASGTTATVAATTATTAATASTLRSVEPEMPPLTLVKAFDQENAQASCACSTAHNEGNVMAVPSTSHPRPPPPSSSLSISRSVSQQSRQSRRSQ
ncbi:hypothetical protein BX616_001666, partial [Lobosporangium transversale]